MRWPWQKPDPHDAHRAAEGYPQVHDPHCSECLDAVIDARVAEILAELPAVLDRFTGLCNDITDGKTPLTRKKDTP